MAQPVNTFDSYDSVGIREDLQDIIVNISPEETPFYSRSPKTKAAQAYHEHQTDVLRPSATNAHIEGDDTTPEAVSPTTRLGNYTQIFKNAVVIPGSDKGTVKAGRGKEMAYQVMKIAKEQKLDIEKALFANQARDAGSSATPRYLAGMPAWITTNTANVGSGGSDPTGDGTDARTDGTETALTQADFDSVMQSIWTAGGRIDTCYLSPNQMTTALGFTGNNNQRSTIAATRGQNSVVKDMDVYVTPWGAITFQPSRECRDQDVFLVQSDKWNIAIKRPMFNEALGKTGDNDKRQIISELTLVSLAENANGLVADCS